MEFLHRTWQVPILGIRFAYWMIIWGIIALIIWGIFSALNWKQHCGHKKRCGSISGRVRRLRSRMDRIERTNPSPLRRI
jgi:hypothetical protein